MLLTINAELTDFINGAIPSVWALEILLLLRRDPNIRWTSERAATELRSNANLAAKILAGFEAAGLAIVNSEGYAYSPASAAIDELCTELERTYRERPVSVLNAIVSLRTNRLQAFADAFRLREGPKK